MNLNIPKLLLIAIFSCCIFITGCASTPSAPNKITSNSKEIETDHDAHMEWWRDAHFGMFIHFGLYSEHGNELNGKRGGRYSEWFIQHVSNKEYAPIINRFNPVDFDANAIVALAKQAGMKYIIITTKHHDGFSLWDSASNPYNVMASPFKRDVMQEMVDACKRHNMRLGWYYSILDWHHPDYLPRRKVDTRSTEGADYSRYLEYMMTQLNEIFSDYGEIATVWFDGHWDNGPEEHRSKEIIALTRRLQPNIIINDRTGLPGDYASPEQHIPEVDKIPARDWEACMTIGTSWGYNKFATDWKSSETLIRNLVDITSKGGNYLLNIGPNAKGVVIPEESQRLKEIGEWMSINGESIHGTRATPFHAKIPFPWGRCTIKSLKNGQTHLYLHVFDWPANGKLLLPELGSLPDQAYLLANKNVALETTMSKNGGIEIVLPKEQPDPVDTVIVLNFKNPVVTYHPPQFDAIAETMITSRDVILYSQCPSLEIRYTLDGNPPTKDSPLYSQPITLTETTKILARSFYNGRAVSDIVESTYTLVKPHPAKKITPVHPGLTCQYVEAEVKTSKELASLMEITNVITEKTSNFDFSTSRRQEHFGLLFNGFIDVPEDALYEFELTSDDGAQLWIQDQLVADNDGLHAVESHSGTIALAKGLHPIRLIYFNGLGGKTLCTKWAPVGQPLTKIEDSSLFQTN